MNVSKNISNQTHILTLEAIPHSSPSFTLLHSQPLPSFNVRSHFQISHLHVLFPSQLLPHVFQMSQHLTRSSVLVLAFLNAEFSNCWLLPSVPLLSLLFTCACFEILWAFWESRRSDEPRQHTNWTRAPCFRPSPSVIGFVCIIFFLLWEFKFDKLESLSCTSEILLLLKEHRRSCYKSRRTLLRWNNCWRAFCLPEGGFWASPSRNTLPQSPQAQRLILKPAHVLMLPVLKSWAETPFNGGK